MNRLILIRHGESTGNIDPKYYKLPDQCVCLTTNGVNQAIDCGMFLKDFYQSNEHHKMVFSFVSEYARAQQTAKIVSDVAGFKRKPMIRPELNERYIGKNQYLEGEDKDDPMCRPIDGESIHDAGIRLLNWLEREGLNYLTQGDVVLFAHGQVMKGLHMVLMGLDPRYYRKPGIDYGNEFSDALKAAPSKNAVPYVYKRTRHNVDCRQHEDEHGFVFETAPEEHKQYVENYAATKFAALVSRFNMLCW